MTDDLIEELRKEETSLRGYGLKHAPSLLRRAADRIATQQEAIRALFEGGFIEAITRQKHGPEQWAQELIARTEPLRALLSKHGERT